MATAEIETSPLLSRAEIERRAADALRASGLRGIVNPVVFCEQVGINARNAVFEDDTVGMITKRSDDVTVYVSAAATPIRKRFAIAHELGHYFLHLPGDGEFVDREVDLFRTDTSGPDALTPARYRDVEANLFAAAFLMPERAVRARWPVLRTLDRMARRFQVSEEAIGLRVAQLGLA